MKTHACFEYQFHQVGQGLFASGCLYQSTTPQPKFLWVYDCGSATSKTPQFWAGQAQRLKQFVHYKPDIDLLTLSHFDDDHICGVVALLEKFNVKTLLLPYAPLWRRMLIAFDQQSNQGDEQMLRYIDPIGYLRQRGNIEQVVIVPPGNDPIPSQELTRLEVLPPDEWKVRIPFEADQIGKDFITEFQGIEADSISPIVLQKDGAIVAEGLWEFCPYNSPKYVLKPKFAVRVESLKSALLGNQTQDRNLALKDLKSFYDTNFGRGGKQRNEISLFLYAGPVYKTWAGAKLVGYGESMIDYPSRLPCYLRRHPSAPGITEKCSILYSGDGFLHKDKTFNDLAQKLGTERMEKLGVFQVNHHGAKENWKAGLARRLNAEIAVFSSDPARLQPGHPHAEVWQDYSHGQRVQVNNARDPFTAGGWMAL
jgi:hypothetical protein